MQLSQWSAICFRGNVQVGNFFFLFFLFSRTSLDCQKKPNLFEMDVCTEWNMKSVWKNKKASLTEQVFSLFVALSKKKHSPQLITTREWNSGKVMRRRKGYSSYLKKQQKNRHKNGEKEPTLEGDRRQCGKKNCENVKKAAVDDIGKYP